MAIPGPLARPLRFLRRQLPPLNFITIHYLYFLGTCLLCAIIFWGASTPPRSVDFTDALFLVVSAMTLAGLNTVNLSTLNTFQQIMLFLLIMLGSAIFVSAFVVQVRRTAFERKFRDVVTKRRQRRRRSLSGSRLRPFSRSRRRDTDLSAANEGRTSSTIAKSGSADTPQGVEDLGAAADAPDISPAPDRPETASPGIRFDEKTHFPPHSPNSPYRRHEGFFSMQGVGARPDRSLDLIQPVRTNDSGMSRGRQFVPPPAEHRPQVGRYFNSFGGWISRNSQFHGLTDKERERLGGYEYRAVSLLAWLVPLYFVLFQLLGCLGCAAWVAYNQPDTAQENGLNPWWVGAVCFLCLVLVQAHADRKSQFNAVSAFNNSGMSLLDANMVAFQTSVYLLLTMGFLILAGNTCYPIFLRLIVWTMFKIVNRLGKNSEIWAERARTLRFLLDHPRRCYTNLFPSQHTWWLLLSVITLNGIDWAGFEILNIGNTALYYDGETVGTRVIDGLFQAFAVRSGGFYVVTIANLRISLQVLYVVMMYISVYPVVITMRNSNVYEERSLGIYAEDEYEQRDRERESGTRAGPGGLVRRLTTRILPGLVTSRKQSNSQFVRQQLRAQLAHDAWTVVVALFLIMIIEGSAFSRDPVTFSVFNFLFEIVSAYGCVGISVGVPYADYSFCGSWQTLSKLILCVVMLRGRHRGLPVAIDKAVLLPGDQTGEAEEDDGRIRLARVAGREGGPRSEEAVG